MISRNVDDYLDDETYMCHCCVNRIHVVPIIGRFCYALSQDNANDEAIDSNNSCHYNWNHILHHTLWMADTSVNQTNT
jgi:hypothetical protein